MVFDVTGLQEGQVTFTLRFDPGTGASCDPLTFTITVDPIPAVLVQFKTFISPEAIDTFPLQGVILPYFIGDGRGFSATAGPSECRTYQSIVFVLNGVSSSPIDAFGTTVGYDDDPTGSDVVAIGPSCQCSDPWESQQCMYRITPWATPDCTQTQTQYLVTAPVGQNGLYFMIDASNPCLTWAPAINAEVNLEFRNNNGVLEVRMSGQHDRFPWYELYLNNWLYYSWDPCASGDTPIALFGPEQAVPPEYYDWQSVPGCACDC